MGSFRTVLYALRFASMSDPSAYMLSPSHSHRCGLYARTDAHRAGFLDISHVHMHDPAATFVSTDPGTGCACVRVEGVARAIVHGEALMVMRTGPDTTAYPSFARR